MFCTICKNPLSIERIEGLTFLEKPEREWACVNCAEQTVRKVKSIYPGIVMSGAFLADNISRVSGIQREPDNYDLDVDNDEDKD